MTQKIPFFSNYFSGNAASLDPLGFRNFKEVPKLYFTRSGYADLPLHNGKVPGWLYNRMSTLGGAIIHSVVMNYGKKEAVRRFSDPFWFQALGCVLGMDWHSSGITTSVLGSLKRSVNPMFNELGLFICGGKGKHSLKTPEELLQLGNKTGIDGNALVRSSKLVAKVDNNAIQDGFQVYLHSFIVSDQGDWSVVQQGMNPHSGMARRYHWSSDRLQSFIEEPHTSIVGENQGLILDLTNKQASPSRSAILEVVKDDPSRTVREIQRLIMSRDHQISENDVNLKRLGAVLAVANDSGIRDFESLLLLKDVGPRTIQSLTLVSEVIHGTPSRFTDPARFSFAHGGKDGYPFAVPERTYDETIEVITSSIEKAKIGDKEKFEAIKNLSVFAQKAEEHFRPSGELKDLIAEERKNSWKYGGRTVFGKVPAPDNTQLNLFE